MHITLERHEAATVLILNGDIDAVTSLRVSEALNAQLSADTHRLVLDLSEVDYISSAGLRSLLAALKEARQRGGDLRLAGVQGGVMKVFDMSGFTSILAIFDDTPQALRSFEA